jgi:hypothetical protein
MRWCSSPWSRLRWRRRGPAAHDLLSSMFLLSGWTVLIYMAMPIIRITTGAQPLADTTAEWDALAPAVPAPERAVAGPGREAEVDEPLRRPAA